MISLTPIIQLLSAKPVGFDGLWFRQVGGGGSFAQIRADALPLPAAWVVRAGDKVRHAGERTEDVTLAFDIIIAVENAREHYAGEADDQLLAYRKAVKHLLLGWEFDTDTQPIKFAGGQVLEYTDGDIYWRDRYEFNGLVTNYLPDPTAPFDSINYQENDLDHYL